MLGHRIMEYTGQNCEYVTKNKEKHRLEHGKTIKMGA